MASFASRTPQQFAPYTPQFDLGLYAAVGTNRQEKYDTNLQKVKNYQQSVYGIQTARDIDSQYVRQMGDQLTSDLQQLAGADFAKEQVLSQAGGMASKIYNDKNIQNIAISTQNYLDANKQIEQAHKDGKSSVTNDHALLRNIQAWQKGDLNATLGKQRYTNFFDYQKGFQDFMKDKHGNVVVEQNPFSQNEDGSPNWNAYALVEGKKVYLDPMSVAQDAQTYFASNGQAKGQLDIDALYYSDTTPDELAYREFQERNRADLSQYDKTIADLRNQKVLNNGNSRDIDLRISQYENAKAKAATLYSQRERDFLSNPQAAKMALYQQSITQGFANRFAYSDLEQKIIKNPIFEGQLEEQKFNLSQRKFDWDRVTWQQDFALKTAKQRLDEREFEQKYGMTSSGGLTGGGYEPYNPTPEEYLASVTKMGTEVKQEQLKVMYDMGIRTNVTLGRDSEGNPLYSFTGNDSDFQKAWSSIEDNYQSNPQGANPFLKKYFSNQTSAESGYGKYQTYLALRDQTNKIESELEKDPQYRTYLNSIQNVGDLNQVIATEGGTSVTRGDLVRYVRAVQENKSVNDNTIAKNTGLTLEKVDLIARKGRGELQGFLDIGKAIVSAGFYDPSDLRSGGFGNELQKIEDAIKVSSTFAEKRKSAYSNIVQNAPRISLTQTPDGSNAKTVEDKIAQLSTIANDLDRTPNSQGNYFSGINDVIGDKKGKVTVGARVDPLSKQITAFVTNTNGSKVQEIPLSPENARALFPQLTMPDQYGAIRDRLNANRPQRGVASVTGSGGQGAFVPSQTNLSNYSIRYQISDDGQGNYTPIIQYKQKGTDIWSDIYQHDFLPSVEQAVQLVDKIASLDDAVFENTYLK